MDKGFQCCNSWVPTPGVHLAPDASTTFPRDCIDDIATQTVYMHAHHMADVHGGGAPVHPAPGT